MQWRGGGVRRGLDPEFVVMFWAEREGSVGYEVDVYEVFEMQSGAVGYRCEVKWILGEKLSAMRGNG